jgi:hypothetical protein
LSHAIICPGQGLRKVNFVTSWSITSRS